LVPDEPTDDEHIDGEAGSCFLCTPDPELVFYESENFIALCGLGPITPGYAVFASRAHLRSMFDLGADLLAERAATLDEVVELVGAEFVSPIVVEHGRVGLCGAAPIGSSHEAHCFHAHHLLFPQSERFDAALRQLAFRPLEFPDFNAATVGAGHLTEYLYYEDSAGVLVGHVEDALPRQFFRAAAAAAVGAPHLADWRKHPQHNVAVAAAARLRLSR
jgi:hypothetical protein